MEEGQNSKDSITKTSKKKLRWALYQFIFGIIFLIIAILYLSENPAERISITSGPKFLYENTKIFFYKIFSEKGGLLEKKYSMEKNYKELILTVEGSNCLDVEELSKLNSKYKKLKNMGIEKFSDKKSEFEVFALNTYEKIDEKCNIR